MLAESLGVNRSLVRVCFTTLMSFTSLIRPIRAGFGEVSFTEIPKREQRGPENRSPTLFQLNKYLVSFHHL